MKNIDINEYRAKKEGAITVKSLLTDLNDRADDFEHVVVVVLDKDGYVNIGHSDMDSSLKLLGLVEAGKNQVINKFTNS